MSLIISDDIIQSTKMTEKDLLLKFALWLFRQEKITLGQASRLAGLSQFEMQRELGMRKISIHYGFTELHDDLNALGIPIP